MPIIASDYAPPLWLCNGHVQTLWPVLFRPSPKVAFRRERLDTPDGDFLDLDVLPASENTERRGVAVLSHGLEGNSRRKYMLGMAAALAGDGWDVVARNLRGCSGEPNRVRKMYHMGETEDLHAVILWCLKRGYERIVLVGFSLGGNQLLKYLGEAPDRVPPQVCGAAAFSVPCDLVGAARVMDRPACALYMEYFLRTLRTKMYEKAERFPDFPPVRDVKNMHTFAAFDDRFTGPLHGFRSARDYWEQSGCLPFLENIRVPALLVNAADDPFLSSTCYPRAAALRNACLNLEIPEHGGHVGFATPGSANMYWSEKQAVRFLRGVSAADRRAACH